MGLEVRKAQERTVEARALLLPLGAGQLSCLLFSSSPFPARPARLTLRRLPPPEGLLRAGPEHGPQPPLPPSLRGWGLPPPCAAPLAAGRQEVIARE